MKRRMFEVRLQYFKPGGKYYNEGTAYWVVEDCGSVEHHDSDGVYASAPTAYMPEIVDRVCSLPAGETLPGFARRTWDGPILVDCPDGFPVLLPFGNGGGE